MLQPATGPPLLSTHKWRAYQGRQGKSDLRCRDLLLSNLILSIMGAFGEFKWILIRKRQHEGTALAKQLGAYRARKRIAIA